ncbi:MAG: DUF2271 domain-containing protein [Alphaproteobacteria bacterium]|nr:MAG: DUF2271 domain-containing protein [Alphaproteobacteria bacterium]
MKSTVMALATTATALTPLAAEARQVTFTTQLNVYGGKGAYLAFYVTDAQGKYVGSLWMAGPHAKYYRHLPGWMRATGGNPGEVAGITGASVGPGRTLKINLNLNDALFDKGYKLHIDAAAENFPEIPNDVVVNLTSAGKGKPVAGRGYVKSFTYSY